MWRLTHARRDFGNGGPLNVIGLVAALLLLLISGQALAGQAVGPRADPAPSPTPLRIYLPVILKNAPLSHYADLGDAPDSSNTSGTLMTAYPQGGPLGVLARFPTVFGIGSPPHGPLHLNQVLRYYLGPAITAEKEADTGPDADGVNNLQPPLDRSDQDKADDGVLLPAIPNCLLTTLAYTVTVPPGAPASKAYVNVWFDWDRSGAWGGSATCPGFLAAEWAVQNQIIALHIHHAGLHVGGCRAPAVSLVAHHLERRGGNPR
jgi:hypothetical protein